MNRFLHDNDAVFIHIPRTGGTWMRVAMRRLKIGQNYWTFEGPSYLPRSHRLPFHCAGGGYPGCLFTVVRDPIGYYESVWKWIESHPYRTINPHWRWHPFMSVVGLHSSGMLFDEWVETVLDREPCWYTRLVEDYVGPRGGEYCDYVGRTDTLLADLAEVARRLGIRRRRRTWDRVREMERVNVIPTEVVWPVSLKVRVLHEERVVVSRFFAADTIDDRLYARWAR
jgi:hypothetical protein